MTGRVLRSMRLLAVLSISAASCAARTSTFYLPDGRGVDALISTPPPAGQNITVTEIQRGENSSVSVVQVRDREQPHVHTRYDLTVVVARGTGTLWLNGTALPMQKGDAAFIPKGTPHYFVNDGSEPAAAIVVFSPPFSGPDQQPVK
jgi:quercetin dioxygenase-like cupin family protein